MTNKKSQYHWIKFQGKKLKTTLKKYKVTKKRKFYV